MYLTTDYFAGLLFQPLVKEGIKYLAGATAFSFGLVEAYAIYQTLRGRGVIPPTDPLSSGWLQIATKIVLLLARTSLLLSALSSRPAVFILSTLIKKLFPSADLELFFGPNTIFAHNPWHPRHICSLAGIALAIPLVIHALYISLRHIPEDSPSYNSLRQRIFINIILSRPLLHLIGRASL